MDQHVWPGKTTPIHTVWTMALDAIMVKCESFIYLGVVRQILYLTETFMRNKLKIIKTPTF